MTLRLPDQDGLTEQFLSVQETAACLELTSRTLARWRSARTGPPWCKCGRKVFYRRRAIVEWLAAGEIQPVRNTRHGGRA